MTETAATKQVARVAEKSGTELAPEQSARAAPLLKPDTLTWNSDGFVWRDARVLLPASAILQDLNDPGIWRSIQSTPQKALRPLDRLTIIAFCQSWLLKDAIVVEADHARAVLAIRPGMWCACLVSPQSFRQMTTPYAGPGSALPSIENSMALRSCRPSTQPSMRRSPHYSKLFIRPNARK